MNYKLSAFHGSLSFPHNFLIVLLFVLCNAYCSSAFSKSPSIDFSVSPTVSGIQKVFKPQRVLSTEPKSCTGKTFNSPDCYTLSALGSLPPSTIGPTVSSVLGSLALRTFGSTVSALYQRFPLTAGFITCSVKAFLADTLAQWRDVCTTKFNIKRSIAMMLYSGSVLGILCEIMYNRLFPIMFGTESTMARSIKMTMFDAFVNAPLLWLPPAYLTQALLYGYPKREAMIKYIRDVRENNLLQKYWSLWVPASFLNFTIIPSHFRVGFVAFVSFFWMIVLSIVANKKQDPETSPVEPEPVLLNPRALD